MALIDNSMHIDTLPIIKIFVILFLISISIGYLIPLFTHLD